MEILLNLSLKTWGYIIFLLLMMSALVLATLKIKPRMLWASLYMIMSLMLFLKFKTIFLDKILFFIIIPSIVLGVIGFLITLKPKIDTLWDAKIETTEGVQILKNVRRGVLIFGAAGSGKTESPVYTLLKHFGQQNYTGVLYDYKDGELSEIAKPLFKDRLKPISLHRPSQGYRINPIAPKYISDEKDINEVVAVLLDNLAPNVKHGDFFNECASGLLTGLILKFHFDHPEFCTLPHVIAFILAVDFSEKTTSENQSDNTHASFAKLKAFLLSNQRASIQASAFIMGLDSEKLTASVLSTLANLLRKIAFPEAFWVLSGNEIDLDVNNPQTNSVITVINEPKSDAFLTPVLATVIHTITKQMMVRDRLPSFVLLDEAPTIKLRNMAKIPATMRSFGVATVYCAQDLVQGVVQYGEDGFKEITANLSTQFFGKANDPKTAKFYEGYFDYKKEQTKSISKSGAGGSIFDSTKSTTYGEREITQTRAIEFLKLKVGQFAFSSDGKTQIIKFKRQNIARKTLIGQKQEKEIYQENYTKIINDVKNILK